MACGCGKSREERMAERQERAERIRAVREQKAALRAERLAQTQAAKPKAA